jgi:hypothetical protein
MRIVTVMSCPSLLQRQTVSKPRFLGVLALQSIDFIRSHFQKIDF